MSRNIFINPGDDIQRVLDCAPENTVIHLGEGRWRQKLVIRTPGITLIGSGADSTSVVFDDYARKLDENGMEYNTFRTYTIAVCADGVTFKHLSVINDALCPETKGQEIALTVYGDNFLAEDCVLSSTQDTLFVGPLPPDLINRYNDFLFPELRQDRLLSQKFIRCRIEGTVDFIFGCGNTLFEQCEIKSLADARNTGYTAAPAHSLSQKEGFLFRSCAFTCEPAVETASIYLARPWRDYGLAVFEKCTYERHIAPCGFDKWSGTDRDRTARFIESPVIEGRVPWANRMQ